MWEWSVCSFCTVDVIFVPLVQSLILRFCIIISHFLQYAVLSVSSDAPRISCSAPASTVVAPPRPPRSSRYRQPPPPILVNGHHGDNGKYLGNTEDTAKLLENWVRKKIAFYLSLHRFGMPNLITDWGETVSPLNSNFSIFQFYFKVFSVMVATTWHPCMDISVTLHYCRPENFSWKFPT